MKKELFLLICAVVFFSCNRTPAPAPCLPVPTQSQIDLQDMEMYAFIHYSINTYTNMEWGYGDESALLFNPAHLDARQWAQTCKNAGMKGIILTVKHHCGFCLWPSQYTEYSVKNSPWKDGKGDVVKDLSEACKELGLKFGVYLSPWDRNHKDYGRDEYVEYFHNQMRELLTQYGDIFEIWFDGANGGNGYYGGANEVRTINKSYYKWEEAHRLIKELQPNIIIWTDAGSLRGDLRWIGTEAGNAGDTNWSTIPSQGKLDFKLHHSGDENGDVWSPGETNTSIRPGWFYHTSEDGKVSSLSRLMNVYYRSVGRNSTLLLNFPVNEDGLIPKTDSLRGVSFYNMIKEIFSNNLAKNSKVECDSYRAADKKFGADKTVDGDSRTYWSTDDEITTGSVTVNLQTPTTFNRFAVSEYIALGQRVKRFSVEALVDGNWINLVDELNENPKVLTTIGHKRIICFPAVTATSVRLNILEAKASPCISEIGIYNAPDIDADLPENGEKHSAAYSISSKNTGHKVNTLFVELDGLKKINGFRFLPLKTSQDGMPLDYVISATTDGKTWKVLAEGEFSNIVNNPIWQDVNFAPTDASLVKIDCDRITGGSDIKYSDLQVVIAQ